MIENRLFRISGLRASISLSLICGLAGLLPAQPLEQEPLNGFLEIVTAHQGLQVKIDGKVVGMTPLPVQELAPGIHQVLVSHPEHGTWLADDWLGKAEISKGETTVLRISFELVYSINSRPFGAFVFRGDQPAGKTPLFLKIPEMKTEQVTLTLATFADTTFEVGTDSAKVFDIKLRPKTAQAGAVSADFLEPRKQTSNLKLIAALGVSVVSGAMALYFRDKADDNYNRYLRAGDPRVFNKHYDDAKKYDKFAAVSFATFQVSFVFSFYLFLRQVNR